MLRMATEAGGGLLQQLDEAEQRALIDEVRPVLPLDKARAGSNPSLIDMYCP
jgi:hypothetical protein